mgnify:CR=1 FL=1
MENYSRTFGLNELRRKKNIRNASVEKFSQTRIVPFSNVTLINSAQLSIPLSSVKWVLAFWAEYGEGVPPFPTPEVAAVEKGAFGLPSTAVYHFAFLRLATSLWLYPWNNYTDFLDIRKKITSPSCWSIKHEEESFIRYPKTEKWVEKTRSSRMFSTNFSVFGYLMKHSFECLM